MAGKNENDRQIEDRIRAHIREKMTRRGMGVTEAAAVLGASQPNLSRILLGERGVSAGLAYRVSMKLTIDLEHLFHRDPPAEFWRYYVPRQSSGPGSNRPAKKAT